MKLALVVHDFDPGFGQGRYAIEIARRLAPEHQFDILANTFAVPVQPGWRYVPIPAWRTTALTTVFSFLAAAEPRLRRLGPYDLVHCQGLTSWRADVITAHVCNAARTLIDPPTRLRSRLFPALVNPVEARFYRQARPRHLIAISRRVAADIRDHYGWQRPVSVIHHGVDTAIFRPPADEAERQACRARFRIPDGDWLWLFVGEATKGLRETLARLPDFPAARLLVVSRSPADPYQQLAARLGVADRLHYWGPSAETAAAYRAADLFVYPSRYDSFGMVVAEAMASGLPVIVGREVGAADLIRPDHDGWLVDPSSLTELAGALARARSEPDRTRTLARRARETMASHDWDACARATLEAYRAALRH